MLSSYHAVQKVSAMPRNRLFLHTAAAVAEAASTIAHILLSIANEAGERWEDQLYLPVQVHTHILSPDVGLVMAHCTDLSW